MSAKRASIESLQSTAADVLRAHHTLGRMSCSVTAAEFTEAVSEFLVVARSVSQVIARLGASNTVGGDEHDRFVRERCADVAQHPLEMILHAGGGTMPAIYARQARGSGLPPSGEGIVIARMTTPTKRQPDDFFFEDSDANPAILLCADYLEHVTRLLDQSRLQIRPWQ